jgi:molybdate transport system permease protein
MDGQAFLLSLKLAAATVVVLLPLAVIIGRILAWREFNGKAGLEALTALPLVLPPTVLGFYLLSAFGLASPLGMAYQEIFGRPLVFSFDGLLLASLIANLPFAVQPVQRAFEAIPRDVREAAWCCGMNRFTAFRRVELPLAWPGIVSAAVLTFAHTVGEFGVVLMVGGAIPGETKTLSIAIYDRVQAFDDGAAAGMSAILLLFSFLAIVMVQRLGRKVGRRYD